MRIGLINELHGDGAGGSPNWESISARASLAEKVGFDVFVFEDAFLYRSDDQAQGVWASVPMAAALCASTERIRISHSVLNSPYWPPVLVANIATTLDEISAGRYTLGIGAGNTPDYDSVGIATDHRYSRFAEAIEIIHSLLKSGTADFDGEYYSVNGAELVLRGPHAGGPPINIAAGGPRMLELVARFGDEWNWWAYDETADELSKRLGPLVDTLDQVCESVGREEPPVRTLDVYSLVPPGIDAHTEARSPIVGSVDQLVDYLGHLGDLGFAEVRCDLMPHSDDAVEAMAAVVDQVHGG